MGSAVLHVILSFLAPAALFLLIRGAFWYRPEKKWYHVLYFPATVLTVITVLVKNKDIGTLISALPSSSLFCNLFYFVLPLDYSPLSTSLYYLTAASMVVAAVEFIFLTGTRIVIGLVRLIRKLIEKIRERTQSDSQFKANALLGTVTIQDAALTGKFVRYFYDFNSEPVYLKKSAVIPRQWITVLKY